MILLHINESNGEGLIFKEWIVPNLAKMKLLLVMSSLSKHRFSIVACRMCWISLHIILLL